MNNALTEQQIHKSIQNEISKSPQITGIHAQNICTILDLECSSDKTFLAVFDSNDGYTKFTYSKLGDAGTFTADYFFRINNDELEYKTSRNPTEWTTYGDDSWMWEDDSKARSEPTSPDEVIKSITLHDVPYLELVENEQEYVGNMLHYYGKISDVDEYGFTDSMAKIAVTPREGWVDLIELTYNELKLTDDSFKEVWGTYRGINEETGLPMLQVFIVE